MSCRAVVVDTERKAVRRVLAGAHDPRRVGVDTTEVTRRSGGAGGNFALG